MRSTSNEQFQTLIGGRHAAPSRDERLNDESQARVGQRGSMTEVSDALYETRQHKLIRGARRTPLAADRRWSINTSEPGGELVPFVAYMNNTPSTKIGAH